MTGDVNRIYLDWFLEHFYLLMFLFCKIILNSYPQYKFVGTYDGDTLYVRMYVCRLSINFDTYRYIYRQIHVRTITCIFAQ